MSWYGPVWQEYYWDDVGAMENRIVQRWHCTDAVDFIEAVLDWLTCKIYSSLERIGKEGNCLMIFLSFFTLLNGCLLTAKKRGGENQKGAQRKLCMETKYGPLSQSVSWEGQEDVNPFHYRISFQSFHWVNCTAHVPLYAPEATCKMEWHQQSLL